jgi:hypothetical protein
LRVWRVPLMLAQALTFTLLAITITAVVWTIGYSLMSTSSFVNFTGLRVSSVARYQDPRVEYDIDVSRDMLLKRYVVMKSTDGVEVYCASGAVEEVYYADAPKTLQTNLSVWAIGNVCGGFYTHKPPGVYLLETCFWALRPANAMFWPWPDLRGSPICQSAVFEIHEEVEQ